jgi:hypothetical protein
MSAPPQLNKRRKVKCCISAALRSAGALNASEPIEEPETDGTGDVENHLSDLDFDLTVWNCCRGHRLSLLVGIKMREFPQTVP